MTSKSVQRRLRLGGCILALVGLATTATACGSDAPDPAGASFEPNGVRIMVPAAAGGGQDQLGRAVARVLEGEDLVEGTVEVFNVDGAGGIVALSTFTTDHRADPQTLMAFSLGLVGAEKVSTGKVVIENDTTPIAQLASEYNGLVVKADSPLTSVQDVAEALKKDPSGLRIGGAAIGNLEHLVAGNFARAIDVEPTKLSYIPYESGAEQITALISGDVDVAVSGLNEMSPQIESGELRVLAVSSPEPIEGIEAPTFVGEGYGDDMVIANWRGLLAPPGIADEDKEAITKVIAQMHESPEWTKLLETNDWADTYKDGDEFEEFFKTEAQRINDALTSLGLVK